MPPKAFQPLLSRYLSVGLIATLIHYMVFLLSLQISPPLTASIAGGVAGVVVSFFGNRKMCFVTTQDKRLQPLKFFGCVVLMNSCNALGMWLLLVPLKVTPIVSQLLVTLVLTPPGFLINRYWAYHNADITLRFRAS